MFWAPCSSGCGGVGGWGWQAVRGAPHTCAHAHACTSTCMHGKHDNFMQKAASIGFLGNPREFPMMSYVRTCMHVHACVCICVGGTLSPSPPPSTHPHHHPPTPRPPGGTLRISQNSMVLELIEIFQFFLKI